MYDLTMSDVVASVMLQQFSQAVREAATLCPHPLQVDLESDVRVTCDVGYLCVKLSLPRSF